MINLRYSLIEEKEKKNVWPKRFEATEVDTTEIYLLVSYLMHRHIRVMDITEER